MHALFHYLFVQLVVLGMYSVVTPSFATWRFNEGILVSWLNVVNKSMTSSVNFAIHESQLILITLSKFFVNYSVLLWKESSSTLSSKYARLFIFFYERFLTFEH